MRDMRVRAVLQAEQGSVRLGEDTTNADGSYTIRCESPEVSVVNLIVSVMDEDGETITSSPTISNPKALNIIEPLIVPMTRQPGAQRRIEGQIRLQHGLPAER